MKAAVETSSRRRLLGFACGILAFAAAWVAAAGEPPREDSQRVISGEEIEQALHPQKTRSFVPRGLTRRGTMEAEQSVNLNIPFEHNSSELQTQASEQLRQLQTALNSASLQRDRFVVAGHTDAKGSAQYNKQLSLRRAEAVKKFLVSKGMDAGRLDTVGYGSEKLLEPERPLDPRNRRVEIRDLGESAH